MDFLICRAVRRGLDSEDVVVGLVCEVSSVVSGLFEDGGGAGGGFDGFVLGES